MKIRYELIKRTIAGETFLVPIGEGAKKFNGMFALNELGDFLWERIPAAKDPAELVELVLDIAKFLQVPVIAEGVETEEQLMLLKERGCDIIQGYYFSKPVPPEDFTQFIKKELGQ